MKYRKKPVVIDAVHYNDIKDIKDIAFFMGDMVKTDDLLRIEINTLEGKIYASQGDWIIRDAGGFYPCKPDIFEMTYEPVEL